MRTKDQFKFEWAYLDDLYDANCHWQTLELYWVYEFHYWWNEVCRFHNK